MSGKGFVTTNKLTIIKEDFSAHTDYQLAFGYLFNASVSITI